MFNLAITFVLLLGAILGGGATTVAVAQGAQPGDVLFPVKTWSEDMRLGLATNAQTRFNLELQFSARRAEEIRNGLAAGAGVSPALLARYQNQLQEQLRLSTDLTNDQIIPGLAQIRTQAQLQEQSMAQLQVQDPNGLQTRERVQSMLRTQEQLAQAGMDNPDWLRQQVRLRSQIRLAAPTQEPELETETIIGDNNPWTTGVPTPYSSYGPGTSQNPWTDTTPVPGSGYGPGWGTGDCLNCAGPSDHGGSSGQSGSGNGGP